MRNFFGAPAKKLRTVSDVEDYLGEEEGSVLAFLDKNNDAVKNVYDYVANELRGIGFYFGYVTNRDIRQKFVQFENTIIFIRANILDSVYEDKISVYPESDMKELNSSSLLRWLIKQRQGLMGFRSSHNEFLFGDPLVVVYFPLIIDQEYAPQATFNTLKIRENLMRVAKNFSDRMDFAISDKKQYKHELRNCGYLSDKLESQEPLLCMFR